MSMSVGNFSASVRSFIGGMTLKEAPEASLGGRVVAAVRRTPYICKIDSLFSVQHIGNAIHGVERVAKVLLTDRKMALIEKCLKINRKLMKIIKLQDENMDRLMANAQAKLQIYEYQQSTILEHKDMMKSHVETLQNLAESADSIQKLAHELLDRENSESANGLPQASAGDDSRQLLERCDQLLGAIRQTVADFEARNKKVEGKANEEAANEDEANIASSSDPVVQSQEMDNESIPENVVAAPQQ